MAETALTIAKRNEQTLTHLVEGHKKAHEKLDALAEKIASLASSTPAGGGRTKQTQPVWDWKGDLPSDYTGAVANYSSRKDDAGNILGYQLCVPVQLLTSESAFAYEDGKYIIPTKSKGKGIFLNAVDENTPLPKSFTGKFDPNKGLECVFVSDYLKIPRDNPYQAPNAGTQPHDPIANQIPEDITGEEW